MDCREQTGGRRSTADIERPVADPGGARTLSCVDRTFEEEMQAMINAVLLATVAEMNAQALRLFAEGNAEWTTDDVRSIGSFHRDRRDGAVGPPR